MATTTTRTPKEMLAFALEEFNEADELVKRRNTELANARERASATTGLAAAAERAFNNADADYRLLYEKAEATAAKGTPSQKVVTAAENVLNEAQAVEEAMEQSYKPVGDAVTAAGKCVTQVSTAVNRLEGAITGLDSAADNAPRGSKSEFRNAAAKLRGPHSTLKTLLGTLSGNQEKADKDLKTAPKLPALDRLRTLVSELTDEPGAAGAKPRAKEPPVDAAELERLKTERDAAELTWRQAPEVERTAQTDLRARETALAEAKRFLDSATTAREQAEGNFIERIEVGRPNADGIVVAKVIFVNDKEPEGYRVRWTVEAGELPDPVGTEVRINTQGVPNGNYSVEAHLERA
jgi:hypothetical protein